MSLGSGAKRLKICVLASGRGSNFQAIIEAANKGVIKSEIALLLSNKKDAQALKLASDNDIPAVFLDPEEYESRGAYDREICAILKSRGVSLVVLAGYMKIVTRALIDPFRNRIMNIHPALLPAFPGMNAQRQALDYGVKVSGCTVHFVDEGMDEGPIILQKCVQVSEGLTEEALEKIILTEEHRIYPEAIRLFEEERLKVDGRRVIIAY